MTTVPRRQTPAANKKKVSIPKVIEAFRDWNDQRQAERDAKEEHERLRDEVLMPALIDAGNAYGEKGQHLAIEFDEPIGEYTRMVRRANTSSFIDVDAAEKMLKKKGVLEQCRVSTVTITGITSDKLDDLLETIAKLKLEQKFGVLPTSTTAFSQEAMYAVHQRHRQELQEREDRGDKIPALERRKYLTEADIDGLLVSETKYSFYPEKTA